MLNMSALTGHSDMGLIFGDPLETASQYTPFNFLPARPNRTNWLHNPLASMAPAYRLPTGG